MNETDDASILRDASPDDEPQIAQLIEPFVAQRKLLPRTDAELTELIRNAFVIENRGKIVGFAAIQIYSRKLAEIQCLAVDENCQGQGMGRKLIDACVARARQQGVIELMAITSSEQLFARCGFHYALPDEKKALFINP